MSASNIQSQTGKSNALIELAFPWTHWYNSKNVNEFQDSLGSTRDTPSRCDPYNVLYDALFTPPHGPPFSLLGTAESLEPLIRTAVSKWYQTRFSSNFVDPETSESYEYCSRPDINSTSATPVPVGAFPITLFINLNALKVVLPNVANTVRWNITVENNVYISVVNKLQLSLYYDDFTTDPPTRRLSVRGSEGPNISTAQILPKKAIAAMLMIDFWNPMYSLKRSALMKYLPNKVIFDVKTKTYNVLPQFMSNVRASPASAVEGTPEYEIIQLLNEPDDTWVDAFTTRVNNYLEKVHARLHGDGKAEAAEDYMILAEGRRRLYKDWESAKPDGIGLDEFRMTLPIAAQPDPFPLCEMTESGEVVVVSQAKLCEIVVHRRSLTSKTQSSSKHDHRRFAQSTGGCPAYYSLVAK
ncbi:hypothetical protein C8R44DRAFT_894045 [Mycena epipterygia]|nr:hypothetical protein C8R44DRAFT_894045 [Mycena epipterygia]